MAFFIDCLLGGASLINNLFHETSISFKIFTEYMSPNLDCVEIETFVRIAPFGWSQILQFLMYDMSLLVTTGK